VVKKKKIMTLGFMQNWPKSMAMQDDKTYYIEKIWTGFYKNGIIEPLGRIYFDNEYKERFGKFWDAWYTPHSTTPKIHTIRRDENERWKPGMDIHFVINSRTKDRFQFAPVVKCTSVQQIEIVHRKSETHHLSWVDIKVDGRLLSYSEAKTLLVNDGFESIGDFLNYFNKDFKGRLIHWTNLSY
jgi:hypothetical protein